MKRFEYDISRHPADDFTQLVYFCTDRGECRFDQIPGEQARVLSGILDEKGAEGWELVQLNFGTDGAVAFWKREK
jgi:hypothetical protein